MPHVDRGCLLLSDITGYTQYLNEVELEHSHDVLADLLGVVLGQLSGALHIANLEGDAVFCYDRSEIDGSMLLTLIDSCYFAFSRRVRTIHRQTTCQCNACRMIPKLNLKFLVHHGQYVIHTVGTKPELMGRDVVLVHRLLKSAVTAKTGLRGYAFFSEACLERFPFNPAALGMIEHREQFEDFGEVAGYVYNLEARWQEEQARHVHYIAPGQGIEMAEFDLPAAPPLVWDYLTSSTKRPLWQGSDRVEEHHTSGIRGVGTTNHCIHGKTTIEEEITDWKPFRYFSFRGTWGLGIGRQMGPLTFTVELTPIQESHQTHVSWRMSPGGGLKQRLLVRVFRPQLRTLFHVITGNLVRLLSAVQAESMARAEAHPVIQQD